MTHAERMLWIAREAYAREKVKGRTKKEIAQDRAHVERQWLIYKPFPVVRRLGTGSALPWGGTIVGDKFYGDGHTDYTTGGGRRSGAKFTGADERY